MNDIVFGLLAQAWVPWALSGLIAGCALASWIDFRYRRIEPVLSGLDQAIALVEASEGASGFKRRFNAIYKGLADNPIVGEVWRAYASTIAPAPGTEDALGYSRRPRESFDDGLLAVAGVNLRLYHAVPNLLVGTGLLFTFLGLVAALYFASRGIAAAAITEAQHALRELLAAATFKFVTSIAGLGSSLIFSWREKALLYRVQRRLARLCASLEERMVPVTSESLATNQLVELKAQHAELRKLSRNLILRVPEEIEARLAEELGNAVVPLRQAIADAASRLERLDEWVMEALLDALQAAPATTRPHPGGERLRTRLGSLVAGFAAADGANPSQPAPEPPTTTDLPAVLRAPLPLLRRLDERLGRTLLCLQRGVDALARWRGRTAGRPADAVRALTVGRASLEEARAAAARLARELEQLAEALPAMAPPTYFQQGATEAGLPPALGERLSRLDRELSGWLQAVESKVVAASGQLDEAVARLETAERG